MGQKTTLLMAVFVLCCYGAAVRLSMLRPLAVQAIDQQRIGYRISLNDADADTLHLLPGIGPNLAAKIIAYRQHHGRFTSVAQLEQVSGIGPKTLARIAPLIQVVAEGTKGRAR
jgi:competence ComEA-like helix-hairpin-helix protein